VEKPSDSLSAPKKSICAFKNQAVQVAAISTSDGQTSAEAGIIHIFREIVHLSLFLSLVIVTILHIVHSFLTIS